MLTSDAITVEYLANNASFLDFIVTYSFTPDYYACQQVVSLGNLQLTILGASFSFSI
jgi:hypothetical protein